MRSSQRRSLLARGTKAVLPKQWPAGCVSTLLFFHRKLRPVKEKASGKMLHIVRERWICTTETECRRKTEQHTREKLRKNKEFSCFPGVSFQDIIISKGHPAF